MNKYRNVRLYAFALVMLFIGIAIAGRAPGRKQRPQDNDQQGLIKPIERIEDLRIVNDTSAFTVADIKKISDNLFEITYRNDYSKRITGFEVSVGGMRVQTELILGGDETQFILPGKSFKETYPAQEGVEERGLRILAVVFDDGTGEGDITYIKEITDYRIGMRAEHQRVLTKLGKVIGSKDKDIAVALEGLEGEISSTIPSNQQDSKLDNVGLGTRNEMRRMLYEIRILRSKHQNAQADASEAEQLRKDLLVFKTRSENLVRLALPSVIYRRSTQ
jgi:hypothetical protein